MCTLLLLLSWNYARQHLVAELPEAITTVPNSPW